MPNGNKLNAKHERAILALLETPCLAAAAEKAGVDVSTLRHWRKKPEFQQGLEEARREVFDGSLCRLQAGFGKAVDALLAVVEDENAKPSERISAARTVLDHGYRAEEVRRLRNDPFNQLGAGWGVS